MPQTPEAKRAADIERVQVKPVVSLSPYQAPKVAIDLFDCPVCGAVKEQRCLNRTDGSLALEQHEDRWRPLQDAHDAGFRFARDADAALIERLKGELRRSRGRVAPRGERS